MTMLHKHPRLRAVVRGFGLVAFVLMMSLEPREDAGVGAIMLTYGILLGIAALAMRTYRDRG